MKYTLTFILSTICFIALSQNEHQNDRLVIYGQVWGFLKYFHPAPSVQNWDQVLLDNFDKVKKCEDDLSFNDLLVKLIAACSDYKAKSRIVQDSMQFRESFEWMNNERISIENKEYLTNLLNNKPEFKNKYITGTLVGNPKILNENEYQTFEVNPAINYLALTRYWNVINYYNPYRNVIPENWTKVYKDYISEFLLIENYEEYYFAVRRLTAELRDAHGFIWTDNNPMENYKYAPFYCESVSDGVYISIVWQDSLRPFHIQRMDKIIAVNGKSIDEKWQEIGEIFSTSNDYYLSKATYYLRKTNADSMIVTVDRNGHLITDTLPTIDKATISARYNPVPLIEQQSSYSFMTDSLSGKKYAYIHLGKLKSSEITRKFKRSLFQVDHVIIDIRNYPNWTLPKLTKALIKGKRKFAKFIQIDFDYPGSYIWTESQTIGNNKRGYQGKIYVLVDYNTMSQAEYTVMALQQHSHTIVIGGQTAGADGNISMIPLPFGITSVFSGLGVFYPDGTATQQIGVKRDVPVIQDKSFIEDQRDLILEKALELIRENN